MTEQKIIFGYLSKFCRCTQNDFGILISVFRIFCTNVNSNPEKAAKIVVAALVLHDFLWKKSIKSKTSSSHVDQVTNGVIIEELWWGENKQIFFQSSPSQKVGNRSSKRAEKSEIVLWIIFIGAGQISWQWNYLL